jgi:hypothetical protein
MKNKYEKWGLKINYGTTECLGRDHTEQLQINGSKIPNTEQFKYEYWNHYFKRMSRLTLKLKKKN